MTFQKLTSIVNTTEFYQILSLLDEGTEQTYAGNPNGNLGSYFVGITCWDSTHQQWWICSVADTTNGTAALTTWIPNPARDPATYNLCGGL